MRKRNNKKNNNNGNNKNNYSLLPQRVYTTRENIKRTFLDPHKYITFKYVGTFQLTALTTAGTQQIMNLNSLFDPDRTGTGHQPYGYDQMSALYNRYRVLSTKYSVCFGTGAGTVHAGIVISNGLLAASVADQATFQSAMEVPRSFNDVIGGAGSPQIKYVGDIHLNDLTGVTRTEYLADDRFEATTSASPAELMTLYVVMYNPTASTVSTAVSITLEYLTDLHDPIIVAGS